MYPIDLPSFDINLKEENEQTYVFDIIRKKYLVLTPEEWVRQHILHLLINKYDYPRGLFRTEQGHTYNTLQKRTDILVYNREGGIQLLVECKAHNVKIDEKTVAQAMQYNATLDAEIILVANGLTAFCFEKDKKGSWIQVNDIPKYASSI